MVPNPTFGFFFSTKAALTLYWSPMTFYSGGPTVAAERVVLKENSVGVDIRESRMPLILKFKIVESITTDGAILVHRKLRKSRH